MQVTLADEFWAPRQEQLREHTLPVILERLEAQGVVDNLRRLVGRSDAPRRAMHFSDSDLFKWIEAASLAGCADMADPIVELVARVQHDDGYVHTYYDTGPGSIPRYTDLAFGHEHYCAGHLIEAAIAHHEATGRDDLLRVAGRLADHLCATFGPGRDERTDGHPEVELALARLASATGEERYLAHARWVIEARLDAAGLSVAEYRLGGHAVRALYLASGIAEVALATGDDTYVETTTRTFAELVDRHSYPTGAVGGRWMGEAVGRPFELPEASAYAESCGAVAAAQYSARVWRLTRDPHALDHLELLLFNAVPCGVGAEGDTWFYSQPQAVDAVQREVDPWVAEYDYGSSMILQWFPARRHRWFLVPCCPPNLARMFASVDRHVVEVDAHGDLLVHLPVACRVRGDGWDVELAGRYPHDGDVEVHVSAAPDGRAVRVRRPGWVGGRGHELVADGARLDLGVDWSWWETDARVEGAAHTAFLRRGPVVHCVEGVDVDDVDLRDLVVDPGEPPARAFAAVEPETGPLHRPVRSARPARARDVPTVPYATWANRGTTTMRMRFPTR